MPTEILGKKVNSDHACDHACHGRLEKAKKTKAGQPASFAKLVYLEGLRQTMSKPLRSGRKNTTKQNKFLFVTGVSNEAWKT